MNNQTTSTENNSVFAQLDYFLQIVQEMFENSAQLDRVDIEHCRTYMDIRSSLLKNTKTLHHADTFSFADNEIKRLNKLIEVTLDEISQKISENPDYEFQKECFELEEDISDAEDGLYGFMLHLPALIQFEIDMQVYKATDKKGL